MSASSQPYDHAFPALPESQRLRVRGKLLGHVTSWLLLAILIGTWIAIADGLSRDFESEEDFNGPTVALTYEARPLAWVLAGFALPLLLMHGRQTKLSWTESLLCWFVFCTAAYHKDFSYMKVPGAPIFITDIVLALTLIGYFLWPRLRLPRLTRGVVGYLAGFVLVGGIAAARGVVGHMDKIDVLRDFSINAYGLFMLVGLYSRNRKRLAEQFCLLIVAGALISIANGLSWYIAQPGMRRYIPHLYVPTAFILVIVAVMSRQFKWLVGLPLLMFVSFGVMIHNHRSSFLGLGIVIIAIVLLGLGRQQWKQLMKPLLIGGVVVIITFMGIMQTREGAQYLDRAIGQFRDLIVYGSGDDNSSWRLVAWAEVGQRFLAEPILGEGYGKPLTFALAPESGSVRPHNIYLTILYKTGLTGFAVFALLLGVPMFGAWRTLRRYPDHPQAVLLRAFFLAQLFALSFGAVNPLIESPFMACYFWLNLGFMAGITRQIKRDQTSWDPLTVETSHR